MTTGLFATYEFHSDAGHGWLKVPKAEYKKVCDMFGWKATTYSYQDRGHVYLEEDADLPEFVAKVEAMGYAVRLDERSDGDYSPIRYKERLS